MPRMRDGWPQVPQRMRNRTNIEPFQIRSWTGWFPDKAESHLAPNEIPDLLNVEFTESGGVRVRNGFVDLNEAIEGMTSPTHVLAPSVHVAEGGIFPEFTQQVLWFDNPSGRLWYQSLGNLYARHVDTEGTDGGDFIDAELSVGPWSSSAVNAFRVWEISAVTMFDTIYITSLRYGAYDVDENGDPDTYHTLDGTSSERSKPLKYDVDTGTFTFMDIRDFDEVGTGFPRARCLISKYARLYAANVHGPGFRWPSRIYWSDPDNAESWPMDNYIEVGGDDGSEINCLLPFREQILIFKKHSTWTLVGTDEDTFALYSLSPNLGTDSHYAAVECAGIAYFFDSTSGLWAYDGARFENVSEPVNQHMLGQMNHETSYKVNVWEHDGRIYVSIPTDFASTEQPDVTYVYDTKLNAWTVWDIGFAARPVEYSTDYTWGSGQGIAQDGRPFGHVMNSRSEDFLYSRLLTGFGDGADGVYYPAYFETAWINPGSLGDAHRVRRFDIISKNKADGSNLDTINANVYRNFDDATVWATASWNGAGTLVEWHEQRTEGDVGLWTWIKLKFYREEEEEEVGTS